MPAGFTDDDVRRIAKLAELDVAPDDVPRFAAQIRRILEYAEIVREVDTSDVAPTAQVGSVSATSAWRDDAPAASLPRTDALGGAPQTDRDGGLFRVPKVL